MISTSSSECDCSGPFGFGPTLPTILGNPFCTAARQPLIYYAKIQDECCQQDMHKRKENSNYFKKAFHWYTQELGSGHGKELSRPNHSGFAIWLDEKYNEYLKGQHRERSTIIFQKTSTADANGLPKKRKSKRKFGRMRSPWRRHRNSKESNVNQSIHYILQPQNLSRPASECCQRTSRMQSTTTIMSKESAKCMKVKVKSKSLLNIYPIQNQHDAALPMLKDTNKRCECLNKDAETQYETYSLETFTTPYKGFPKQRKRNTILEKDTVDGKIIKTSLSTISCHCSKLKHLANDAPDIEKHDSDFNKFHEEKQTLRKDILQPSSVPKTSVMFTDNCHVHPAILQNFTVQTSDHSIHLGRDIFKQPLFLKVVCVKK